MAAALVALAAWVGVAGYFDARRFPNLVTEARPFVWPHGCPPAPYGREEVVPKRCAVHEYRIGNATELGLITTGRNTRWYRVGDDAFLLSCFVIGDHCDVRRVVRGTFVRDVPRRG